MNGRVLVAVVVVGLLVWMAGARSSRRGARPRVGQSSMYGSWTSVFGGMRKPFFSTPWFVGFVVLAVLVWLVLA